MLKGKFITFEGIDGCGKGTQIKKLQEYLDLNNVQAYFTREPGGNKVAEKIRNILKDQENVDITPNCELLLFSASRTLLVETVIKPKLENGELVVCDRYVDSCTAYQGYGRDFDLENVYMLNSFATSGIMPDLTILLDLSPFEGLRRNASDVTKMDRFEAEGFLLQEKVRNGFLEIAKNNPERFLVIDATKTPDEIFEIILLELKQRGIVEC